MRAAARAGASLAGSAAFVAAICRFGELRFATNDDVHLLMLVSGISLGEPSGELVVSSSLVGHVLAFLYGWASEVAWYEGCLVASHVAALGAVLFSVLPRARRHLAAAVASIAALLYFDTTLLLRLNFTSSAFLAALGGVVLLGESRSASRARALLVGALLGWAGLLREQSLIGAVVLGMPFLLLRRSRPRMRSILLAGGLAGALLLVGKVSDRLTYGSSEWADFLEYNVLRAELHGTPRLPRDARGLERLPEVGWSVAELTLFRNWFYPDPAVFSLTHLEKLHEITEERVSGLGIGRIVERVQRGLTPYRDLLEGVVLLPVLLLLVATRRGLAAASLCVAWGALLVIYLCSVTSLPPYAARLPPYVGMPLFLGVALFTLRVATEGEGYVASRARCAVALAVAAALLVHVAHVSTVSVQESRRQIDDRVAFSRIHARLRAIDPKGIYVGPPEGFGLEWFAPFWDLGELRQVQMVPMGWWTHSPTYREALRRRGIDDLMQAIVHDPRVHLFLRRRYKRDFESHYRERRGTALVLEELASVRKRQHAHFQVYRAQLLSPAAS